MEPSTIIGTLGVSLLLLAFLLNLFGFLPFESLPYIVINIFGAAIACVASIMIEFIPFIVLEVIWVIVGLGGVFRYFRRKKGISSNGSPFTLDPDRIGK